MGRTTQQECGTAGRRGPGKERPAAWSAYGKLVRLFRERAGLTQQALADAIGYSMEQVASAEQGRRPAKAVFTEAAERVLDAGGGRCACSSRTWTGPNFPCSSRTSPSWKRRR